MTKKLLSNIPLKLMSVVIAIVVWLLVVNVDDPIRYASISGVVVNMKNESYIESAGLMCLVEEDQDIITVEVTGKRSIVDNIKASDITATADLTQIVDMNTTPVMVPITVSCPGISPGNIKASPVNMSITLDDMMTQEFLVTVSSDEEIAGKGYEVGGLQANPEKIKITGPQSLIQKIDKVIATIDDVSGLTEDTILTAGLRIIDKNQEPLSARQMGYLKYDITNPSVNVSVDLWKIRSDITLQAGYVGTPRSGYKVSKISLTPNKVSVAGTDDALNALAADGNVIEIPSEYIDVTDHNNDFETKINLEELLPDGVKLTSGTNGTVIVTVSVLPQDSQEYSVSTTSIQALNVGEGLQVVYETDGIQVRVREESRDLSQLGSSDIKAAIDFTGKGAGTYNMPVTITLPVGYEVVNSVTTAVKIVQDAETENTTEK